MEKGKRGEGKEQLRILSFIIKHGEGNDPNDNPKHTERFSMAKSLKISQLKRADVNVCDSHFLNNSLCCKRSPALVGSYERFLNFTTKSSHLLN